MCHQIHLSFMGNQALLFILAILCISIKRCNLSTLLQIQMTLWVYGTLWHHSFKLSTLRERERNRENSNKLSPFLKPPYNWFAVARSQSQRNTNCILKQVHHAPLLIHEHRPSSIIHQHASRDKLCNITCIGKQKEGSHTLLCKAHGHMKVLYL